ncbi:Protein of unknown function [Propionibacterium freudenreichii]|uniref:Uncharacterized protein n=1 Tax=Propionibacterium freudenreichii subsp. freudenreichii TaxID=66712 RepID=A0A068VST5_PROFF|nr:Protein of unknown function [Propionibacterium freudenreichii subsp. freudenreichii]CEG87099.1 Protein of unknown function [Propionibacterium freudenreichii]CEG87804.1 Protein of unknown function [Propionibacterium freudenreichii]CEG93600.1 Protein of unknown function [Propionibacterium freudenreichii]CEG96288.1 Protein of unknown function [Propionibacterium freudenreichii]
MIRKTGDV